LAAQLPPPLHSQSQLQALVLPPVPGEPQGQLQVAPELSGFGLPLLPWP
jgi:hypothetical protein